MLPPNPHLTHTTRREPAPSPRRAGSRLRVGMCAVSVQRCQLHVLHLQRLGDVVHRLVEELVGVFVGAMAVLGVDVLHSWTWMSCDSALSNRKPDHQVPSEVVPAFTRVSASLTPLRSAGAAGSLTPAAVARLSPSLTANVMPLMKFVTFS